MPALLHNSRIGAAPALLKRFLVIVGGFGC